MAKYEPAIEAVAKMAHDVNKAYCEGIGDFSQPDWEDAPEWQRASAVNGVIFHLENPGSPPSASHESWLQEKVSDGWVYGLVKDPAKKTHPCCVPYGDLPQEQRVKDYLFSAVVRSAAMSGLTKYAPGACPCLSAR